MYPCETMGKGTCIERMPAVKNYNRKHYNERNNGRGGGA